MTIQPNKTIIDDSQYLVLSALGIDESIINETKAHLTMSFRDFEILEEEIQEFWDIDDDVAMSIDESIQECREIIKNAISDLHKKGFLISVSRCSETEEKILIYQCFTYSIAQCADNLSQSRGFENP
jgi:hypothetical protein